MSYKDLRFPESSLFLVTGGAGFIGSNLCEAILSMGYKVRCLDDLSSGYLKNIETFKDDSKFEFIEGDIKNFDTCLKVTKNVDYVLHQAAWGSVPRSIEMPLFYEQNNVVGTLNILEASKQNIVKRFIYASSSSVYGDDPNLPKVEGREGNLLSPYAVTKKMNEEYAKLYYKLYNLPTIGLRYFNVFGKRQNPDGPYAAVIPKFIKQLSNSERPTIYGEGTQSRDFTYIENAIEANLKACVAKKEAYGEIYNIACGESITIIDLYWLIANKLDKKNIEPVYREKRVGDIMHSLADITKAKKFLGYVGDFNLIKSAKEILK